MGNVQAENLFTEKNEYPENILISDAVSFAAA